MTAKEISEKNTWSKTNQPKEKEKTVKDTQQQQKYSI